MIICMRDIKAHAGVQFGTSGVRGPVTGLTDEVCYAYTSSFMRQVVCGDGATSSTVVLGHDLRPSSPRMAQACAAAIRDCGGQVVYAGALPTPALAWYGQLVQAPVLVVTGSHIPFEYNGIKFYGVAGEISKEDEVAIESLDVTVPTPLLMPPLPSPDLMVEKAYIRRYVDFFGVNSLLGLRVAVYQHSSVARDVLPVVLKALGACVQPLGRTDNFVPIDTEAVRHEDEAQAVAWAQEYGFDAIVSTDGDADRPLIGDETGTWLRGDVVGALCARFLKADRVVTPVSSNTMVEKGGWFKRVDRTRIGSPYVIAAMGQNVPHNTEITVGYEANGGVLLGGRVVRHGRVLEALPTRDALLPILALLTMMGEEVCPLSGLLLGLPPRFTASDRLQNFPMVQSKSLIQHLQGNVGIMAATLAPDAGTVVHTDTTDGLRVTFASGDIVHLRPSGNAPELRCYTEANSRDVAQQLCRACLARLPL